MPIEEIKNNSKTAKIISNPVINNKDQYNKRTSSETISSKKSNEIGTKKLPIQNVNKQIEKSYYPLISFKTTINNESNISHDQLILKLIKDICQNEEIGLNSYFFKTEKNHKELNNYLKLILKQLPFEIEKTIPVDVLFEPEYSSRDRKKQLKLKDYYNDLKSYYSDLQKYDDDNTLLEDDFELWINGVPKSITEMDPKSNVRFELNYLFIYLFIYLF